MRGQAGEHKDLGRYEINLGSTWSVGDVRSGLGTRAVGSYEGRIIGDYSLSLLAATE